MGVPVNEVSPDLGDVDVIIAGGGTTACVVAARLSDADPNLSILVIERGLNNQNEPSVIHPALCLANILPSSNKTLFYKGTKESQIADREPVVPAGGVLGGGSSVNLLTYSRPLREDLDSWNTPGWTADDLLPYFKKFETYHGPGTLETHGDSGPIHVSRGPFGSVSRTEEDFIQAAGKLGWPEIPDMQDLAAGNGVARNLRFTSPAGLRQDAAHCYLHPRLGDGKHPNLHVLVEHQVTRVLFEGTKAVGVEFLPDPDHQKDSTRGLQTVKASKLVIVSSGALGTPLVLERSGVGDPEILARAGVDIVADLPGVGQNYMDHHLMTYAYRSSLTLEESADALYGGRLDIPALMQAKDKLLGWNLQDVTSKLRPSEADIAALGLAFQEAWERDYKASARSISVITPLNCYPGDPSGHAPAQYMSVSTFTLYPYSRGHIHITGTKVSDPLDFQTGFFSDPRGVDIKMALWAYKKQREIFRRMDVYRGEFPANHPTFPAESAAVGIQVDEPLKDVEDIAYTPEDDAIIEQWLRQNVGTTWHSMGTCKMAPREKLGVVDSNLNVYGVEGLKIADLSIPPDNVGANTGSTAFAVGEKAADIFIKELGLAG